MLRRCAILLAVCLAAISGLQAQNGRALLQEGGGALSVYNNIVVNNGDSLQDYSAWATYNLFGYHPDIFSHIENDFRPTYHLLIFNRGYNPVVLWSFDLQGNMRVVNDTVELGAFEYPRIVKPYELGYPLYQMPGGNLNICNNIVILNIADSDVVVNVAVPNNNILSDTVTVFMDNENDYNIRPTSIAYDGGDNSCAMVDRDMGGKPRISGSAVDIGIFEHEKPWEKSIGVTIYADPSGSLNICNNIVLFNTADSDLNITVSAYNLVADSADVFFHYKNDYRIRPASLADNTGDNSCVDYNSDMKGEMRVAGTAVELGAFERLVGEEQNMVAWPVFVEDGGSLNFCNNIIINNSADTNVNVPVPNHNMVTDTAAGIFKDMCRDFILMVGSPAIDAGDNSCVVTSVDLKAEDRIFNGVVDLGAFERPDGTENVGFPFWQEEEGTLNLCNNIIINNSADTNINVTAPQHNMVENSHDVFMDDRKNFLLQPYSSAVDGGLNACATWNLDMRDSTRVIHEVIDLGAFEIFVDYSNGIVYQGSTGTLTLCNNVIILNSDWTPNTNIQQVSSDNIVNDQVEVFRDNLLDYRPLQHSYAVDAGNNGCNDLPTDLDTVKRISNGRIDIGAFEIPELIDTNNYAGGDGGGGSGTGGGEYGHSTYNAIVYEENSSMLYLCDNIIVNGIFTANTNTYYGLTPQYCNWVKDTIGIFRDSDYDFRLNPISPVINKGRNDCNILPKDIDNHGRIQQDTIDIGAFEYLPPSEPVALEQVEGYQLEVCNNIIINNVEVFGVNDMNTSGYNLLVDNNYIFKNNEHDYTLREHCSAVNAGVNACCSLVTDLNEAHRIIWDTIDYGAFELNRLSDSTTFTVWEEEGHQLQLCNNIIINNGGSFAVSDANVAGSNLLVDHDDVFRHNMTDYRLRENSIAINAGINSCCSLAVDINDENRIFADTIDYGAFEQNVSLNDTTVAVQQVEGHFLLLCNNIIINNSIAQATNVETVAANNLITDSEEVFVDSRFNFTPRSSSGAVNQGSNSCCPLSVDIDQQSRVYEEVIDIGAFEPRFEWDTANALLGQEGAPLVLCNNIIINNKYSKNLNILDVPANNIVTDSDTLLIDNRYNFRVRSGSAAVNHGSNDCVAWTRDVEENPRIFEEIVDIGAFELYFEETILTAVLDGDTGGLVLCNNIIINNKYAQNVNVESVPENNIVTDNDTLFRNRLFDFMPRAGSSAVNQGDNTCADWTKDIATKSRVFADIIDIGAYEVRKDTVFEFYAVNTTLNEDDPGLGGGSDPGSGGGTDPGTGGYDPGSGGGADPGTGGSDSTANAMKLKLYNNIVIYNSGHTMNVGNNIIGDHNLLEDTPNVFVDDQDTFLLRPQSPAIDAGDNQWVAWATDIKDDPRIACASIVDQGAYEHSFTTVDLQLLATMVETDNCQGYYFELTATEGAQHYLWSHSNEDTNVVQVSPLIPTEYTVIATSGGECSDTASVYVVPSEVMSDSLGAPASVGTTFWLSYLRNHFRPPTLTLNVSAEEACTGTVSNPRTGWSVPFSVAAHSVTTVSVPLPQAYPSDADAVGDFGLLVQTTDSVSLYAANYNVSSFDVTDVLPIDALSDEYLLQTYTPMMNAEFVIVATEDSTLIDILPSRALQGGHPAQQTFSVMLHQGQTYLGMSQYGGVLGDLSGTLIHAHGNKPVAVFNGNVCALVPANNSYTDHLVEQAVGVNYWGRSFTITTTESQNFDVVRVTALRDNTEVRRNGVTIATLQAYQTHEFQISGADGSCYLETSEPAGVYLYIAGAVQGNPQERSDPSMIWIPPTEQMLNDITFATFNSPGISDHYVNIVVPAAAVDEVTLDGIHIGWQFTLVNGNSAYAFVRKHISNGTHTLHCDGGFIAHCYGLGFHESYGYAAGSKAVPLKEQLFVNGILSTEMPANTKFCPYEPIDFSTYVNYPCDSVVWNFGDGSTTVNAIETMHSFAVPGTYVVAATLYITSNGTVFCTNLYARIRVQAGPVLTIQDTVCRGDFYTQHGFEILAEEAGHATYTRTATVEGQYCDSTYVLELEVLDNYLIVQDTICENNHYQVYGFDITTAEIGMYIDTLNAGAGANGCDSLVILQLLVTPNTDNPPAIEGEGMPCQGGSYTYSIDSLSGLQDVVWTVPDSVILMPQSDPYQIELLFDTYADSMEICVTAMGGCGELHWCRMLYPQPYNFVQIYDTLCVGEEEYIGYGFELTGISDTNDIFYHHDMAAGGCDSTTVLSLVFMPTYEVTDTIIICENEFPYLYHDTLLADTGYYQITLASEFGCDSTVNLTMQCMPVHHTWFYDTVCDAKNWYDSIYTTSGDYDVLLTNIYSCDSLVTMHLTVYYSDTVAVDSSVCRNMLPIVWNGVMFEDAGMQTATLENVHGCDSILLMTLEVRELSADSINVYVLENELPTYSLNGYSYDSSGVYTQMLVNVVGCDSILTVNLTVLSNVSNTVDSTVCQSELPIEWNGVTFTGAGTQFAQLEAANGADSVVVMNVLVTPTTYGVFDTAIVENALPFVYHDSAYGEAGTYTQYLTNVAGCDSVLTVNLTVFPNVTSSLDSIVCEGELPLVWNDSVFTSAGVKVTIIPAHTGADSTITMSLAVIPTTFSTVDTAIVENALPFHSNDSTYYDEGTYTQYLMNVAGCDSVLTVNLTVFPNVTSSLDSSVCETDFPFTWNDSVFTSSAVKVTTIPAHTGADSTITMTVTMIPTTYGTVDTAIVENALPFVYHDSVYDETDTYIQYLTNVAGCDSVLTVNLTVYPNVVSSLDTTVCEGDLPVIWNDSVFTEAGVKVMTVPAHTGADSTITMTLAVLPTTYGTFDTAVVENALPLHYNDSTYYGEGTYTQYLTNAAGCDSVLTVHLEVYENVTAFVDSVVCEGDFPIVWNGVEFAAAGVDSVLLTASTGADSTMVMTVTETPTTYGTVNLTAVENALPLTYNDSAYFAEGSYTQYLTNAAGCDSVLTVNLSVYANVTGFVDSTVCEGELPITWNDSVFTSAGVKMTTIPASSGADSTVVMTLTVVPTTYGTFDTAIVENALPLIYHDSSYNEAGAYIQHFTNAAGCDSILTVNLVVFPNVTTSLDSTVCESALPLMWNGVEFTAAGTDSVLLVASTGADSLVVMTLHVVALPVLTHSADTVIMPGASVSLWATGADIMAWTDADGNTLTSGGNLTVTPTVTTTYYITAFNEGSSVVINGDFENGNTGFTTAYQYSTNLWPEGNYYVGTNAHNYHGNFPNWYDHTSGSGLYLIVNGATVAGTNLWTQTVPVTPHTPYAFSAWVCSLTGGSVNALAQLQFSVNAMQLGDIFYAPLNTGVWNRYYEVWNSGDNTTATLTILNQNTVGGGNDFGVDDILFTPLNFCNATDSVTVFVAGIADSSVCADALPLLWNGVEFTAAGTQTATITSANGMDSVVVMTLTVKELTFSTIDTAIVENALPFVCNDSAYMAEGVYTQTFTNAEGCDSILTVTLTVFPNVTAEVDSIVCESEFPFTWNDSVFTEAGTKLTTIPAHTGADSTIVMTVTMAPTTYGTLDTAVVENALPLQIHHLVCDTAGVYTDTIINAAGCDSVLTVLLTVLYNVSSQIDSTICASELPLTWNGVTFTQAGVQTATLAAATGADSVVMMTLTVNPLSATTIDTGVVQNALPFHYINGQTDTTFAAGTPMFSTYQFTYSNALGCDSVVTLNLTVYNNVSMQVDTTVCAANLPFTWHGHSFTAAGNHTVTLLTSHGADSVVTYHLSVDNISANVGNVTHITCYGSSTGAATATITGGQTPMTYTWTNAAGASISTTTSISNLPAGTYTFTVTDHLGCTATATATLNTLNGEMTPGTIAADQQVCDGEDIAPFTGTAASGGDNGAYQWQISTNGTDWATAPGTANTQNYTYPTPAASAFQLRRAWISQSCGTVYSNTVEVSVWPNSSDTILAEVCQGEIYQENGFDVTADQTAEAGEYIFEQHYATGHCDSAVILLLTVNPSVTVLVEATVCEGEGYSGDGFEVLPQETIGEGALTRVQNLQTEKGCDSVVTLQLTVIDTSLHLEMLTEDFCENMEAALTVLSPMPDYEWSTGETATTIVVTSPGVYSVTASQDGCSATAHIRVEGCHYEFVLPNAITPSRGDGLNDCFYIPERFTGDIVLFKVYIYNRWGELVFYSTDKNFRWYGDYRGQTQYQTIYNYVIEYTDTAGRPQKRMGSITVL